MNLISNVKIVYDASALSDDRLRFSKGSKRVSNLNGQPCIFNTYIQNGDWQPLSVQDQQKLTSTNGSYTPGETILLTRVPDAITKHLYTTILSEIDRLESKADLAQITKTETYCTFVQEIIQYLKQSYHSISDEIQVIGLDLNPIGLESLSFDTTNNCYVGLHLDDWDGDRIYNRVNSRSLFCINMGFDDRYIMFLNLSLREICSLLESKIGTSLPLSDQNPDDLVYLFLDTFPEYPVIKMRISPNEAYIFPIQNVIHEGVTTEKLKNDINFMALISPDLLKTRG